MLLHRFDYAVEGVAFPASSQQKNSPRSSPEYFKIQVSGFEGSLPVNLGEFPFNAHRSFAVHEKHTDSGDQQIADHAAPQQTCRNRLHSQEIDDAEGKKKNSQ